MRGNTGHPGSMSTHVEPRSARLGQLIAENEKTKKRAQAAHEGMNNLIGARRLLFLSRNNVGQVRVFGGEVILAEIY